MSTPSSKCRSRSPNFSPTSGPPPATATPMRLLGQPSNWTRATGSPSLSRSDLLRPAANLPTVAGRQHPSLLRHPEEEGARRRVMRRHHTTTRSQASRPAGTSRTSASKTAEGGPGIPTATPAPAAVRQDGPVTAIQGRAGDRPPTRTAAAARTGLATATKGQAQTAGPHTAAPPAEDTRQLDPETATRKSSPARFPAATSAPFPTQNSVSSGNWKRPAKDP